MLPLGGARRVGARCVPQAARRMRDVMESGESDIHAYVFVAEAGQDTIDRLKQAEQPDLPPGDTGIRFVAPLSGPYDAVAVVQAADVQALQDLVLGTIQTGTMEAGAKLRTETSIALAFPRIIKRTLARPVEAFVRVWVQPGQGRAVIDNLEKLGDAYMGAALVAGDFDILVELGADTFDELRETLLTMHETVEGIARSASSITASGVTAEAGG
ncbi:hypothetical protein BH20CHL6_BH20CHL6_04460 [soil metagenome]